MSHQILTGQFPAGGGQQGVFSQSKGVPNQVSNDSGMPGCGPVAFASGGAYPAVDQASLFTSPNNLTQAIYAGQWGFSIPANAIVQGVQVNFLTECVSGTTDSVQGIRVNNLGLYSGGVRSSDKAPNVVWGYGSNTPQGGGGGSSTPGPVTNQVFGGSADKWGLGAVLTPAYVNSSDFGFETVAYRPLTGLSTVAGFTAVSVTVFYLIPVGVGSVLSDQAFCNNGWTVGDGRVVPITLPLGTFSGVLMGFSVKYIGYLINYGIPGGFHGKLGTLYAGIVRQPQSKGLSGWGSFAPDSTTIVETVWDPEQDKLFPHEITAGPPPQVVPDVRIASFQLPQPIDVDETVPLGVGFWLSPSIGPCVPRQATTTPGWAIGVTQASYALELDGEDVTPVL